LQETLVIALALYQAFCPTDGTDKVLGWQVAVALTVVAVITTRIRLTHRGWESAHANNQT